MKRMLFAGAVALATASPVLAADLPPSAPPPRAPATYVPVASPVYNWSGIYIGVNGGYGFGDSNWTTLPGGTSSGSFAVDGGLVGGTIGANYQMGSVVFGIEADGDWQGLSGSVSNAPCHALGAAPACETQSDWVATVRGRLGFAFDRVLLFGTGGVAFGGVQSGINPPATYQNNTEVGWTAGAGLEYAITDNVTAKLEYLFVDLGNASCNVNCGTGINTPVSFYENVVRAGINFKFNPF